LAFRFLRRERQSFRGQTALAQALHGLFKTHVFLDSNWSLRFVIIAIPRDEWLASSQF
jgi:hypothetical protein